MNGRCIIWCESWIALVNNETKGGLAIWSILYDSVENCLSCTKWVICWKESNHRSEWGMCNANFKCRFVSLSLFGVNIYAYTPLIWCTGTNVKRMSFRPCYMNYNHSYYWNRQSIMGEDKSNWWIVITLYKRIAFVWISEWSVYKFVKSKNTHVTIKKKCLYMSCNY